jgi:hypothetical protein
MRTWKSNAGRTLFVRGGIEVVSYVGLLNGIPVQNDAAIGECRRRPRPGWLFNDCTAVTGAGRSRSTVPGHYFARAPVYHTNARGHYFVVLADTDLASDQVGSSVYGF